MGGIRGSAAILLIVLSSILMPLVGQDFAEARRAMVEEQIEARGITDNRVLEAMSDVPRHFFVTPGLRAKAYGDYPLPIGEGQTISQPYIVALMTESLGLVGSERVLEIGTGSGYQAAVLSLLAREVYSIEIKKTLYEASSRLLVSLGYGKVVTRCADRYFGWPEKAPFDCIMITASVSYVPAPLFDQLKDGGRIVLPLGNPFSYQNLVLITKRGKERILDYITGVLFVPMTGEALKKSE